MDELDDDTLKALGRVAWWGLSLEDVAQTFTHHLVRWDPDEPARATLRRIIAALETRSQTPAIVGALMWAKEARAALLDRHSVLHGVPMADYRTGEVVGLEFLPRAKTGAVRVELTPVGLNVIADRLRSAYLPWRDLAVALSAELSADAGS